MQTLAGRESRQRSRDSRCASCITVDDDDASDYCRLSAEHHSRPTVSSQLSIDDTDTRQRHLVSLSSDSSDVDDFVTDDVAVNNSVGLLSSYSEVNRDFRFCGIASPRWSPRQSHERQLEALASCEQRVELDQCCHVCELQHQSLVTEPRQRSNTQQQHDGGAVGVVVTCYANDQLGIRKTTAKSRSLGVVKTTIESTSLGLVETTVKLDGCPLVRTTLDCRDLDLTETRLYNKELGVLKTTLRSGHDGLIKSSVHENLTNDPHNTTYQTAAQKIENKNVWREGLVHEGRERASCAIQPVLQRQRRVDRAEDVLDVSEDCRCNTARRRMKPARHVFSDTPRKIREKCSSLPVTVAQYGSLAYRRHQNDLHAFANRQMLEDQILAPVPLPSYVFANSGQNTSRVQSGDVSSSTSSSVSGDEMLIIDSLSDDDVIVDQDADEGKLPTDVDCELATVTRVTDDMSDTTIQTDFDVDQQDLCEIPQASFEYDKSKELAELVQQQQAAKTQEVSVDETIQLIDFDPNGRSKSDIVVAEVAECSQRVLVKPCHVLLTRLETDSSSHLQHSTRADMIATTDVIGEQKNNYLHVSDFGLARENVPTASAFRCDAPTSHSVQLKEEKTLKWQNEVAGSQETTADGDCCTGVRHLHLDDGMTPGQETSCQDFKAGNQSLIESLSDIRCNRTQRVLGVVKRCRRKTGKVKCKNEAYSANSRNRNKPVTAINDDEKTQTDNVEAQLHGMYDFGIITSEQIIEPRLNPVKHRILSETSNAATQPNGQGKVTNKRNLTPGVKASKSSAKREVRQAFTHSSKSSNSVEGPKKKQRRVEGFWNLTKQKRSFNQKSFPKKPFSTGMCKETDEQPSKRCHLNFSDKTDIESSVVQQKCHKRAKELRPTCKRRTTRAKMVTKKKTKPKGSHKERNISWKIASLAAEIAAQDSQNNHNEGHSESFVGSSGSKPETDVISHQEGDQSLCEPDEHDGDCEELSTQRDPIIVRFRRYPPESVSSSRQHNDVMRQVIAEIRRVHRRLDGALLHRRRRRQSIASLDHACAGSSSSAAAAAGPIHCDVRSITGPGGNANHPLVSSTNTGVSESSVERLGTVSRLSEATAMCPVRVLVKSLSAHSHRNDTEAVELLLCAAEQRPLQIDGVLASVASSASLILFVPALLTCPTQLLLKEAQLAGDATRTTVTTLDPALVKQKELQRRAIEPSAPAPDQKLLTSEHTDAVSGSSNEQHMTELQPITDHVADTCTPAKNKRAFDTTSALTNSSLVDESSIQLSGTTEGVDCRIDDYPVSAESAGLTEHLQIYAAKSDRQCQTQTTSTTAFTSRTSVDVDTNSEVECERSKASNHRPKSVGASKKRGESTPHRPGWLTPHLNQLNYDWQTPVNCVQRPPTMNMMSCHYAMYYQPPAGQLASQPVGQSRSCSIPRDQGLSRVLPTLSLFDTELDLSECELSSHYGDDDIDVDERTTDPNYQYAGSSQQAPWSRLDTLNAPLLKPEPRHPYDVIMPPHLQSRDYGVYQNQFYPAWPLNSVVSSSHRQHRPRSRCSWWPMDSDQPAPANYAWSPYQHSHYRYHHHHHPYQR